MTATTYRSDAGSVRRKLSAVRTSVRSWGDWPLAIAVLTVMTIGLLAVWSATRNSAGFTPTSKQAFFATLGLTLGWFATTMTPRRLRAWSTTMYLLSVVFLAAVLTPLGVTVNGSRSWINMPGGFTIQPAEFAKLAVLLALSATLTGPKDDGALPARRAMRIAVALVVIAVPVALVLVQPDMGSTLVLLATGWSVLLAAGVRLRWVVALASAALAAAAGLIASPLTPTYQRQRLEVFIRPEADPLGAGYQINQVSQAIANGGLTGQGLGRGQLISNGYVPFDHTDFIVAVIAEDFGLVGLTVMLAAFSVIIWRCLRIAQRTQNAYGTVIATGVACWLTVQILANVGMSVRLTPVTGLPLPMVSYGGSGMLAMCIALGLVLGIATDARRDADGLGLRRR